MFNNFLILIVLLFINLRNVNINIIIFIPVFLLRCVKWLLINDNYLWPITLYYGFNIIHPTLFYLSLVYVGLILLKIYNPYKLSLNFLFNVCTVALILGMFWGGINSGWGFFWTYDQIEFSLVILLVLITTLIHTLKIISNFWIFMYMYLILLIYLTFLRFGLIFTVHSFFENIGVPFISIFLIFLIYSSIFYINKLIYSINILFIVIYIYTKLIYLLNRSYLLKKFYWILHFLFFILLIFIINPTYYYILIDYTTYIYCSFFNININNINNTNLLLNYNSIILYTLNIFTVTTDFYFDFSNYLYSYYLGFFYFFLFFFLLSFLKIYFR